MAILLSNGGAVEICRDFWEASGLIAKREICVGVGIRESVDRWEEERKLSLSRGTRRVRAGGREKKRGVRVGGNVSVAEWCGWGVGYSSLAGHLARKGPQIACGGGVRIYSVIGGGV